MRKLIFISLLFFSAISFSQGLLPGIVASSGVSGVSGTPYYISTTGDNGNDGLTTGTAWATLAYATSQATTSGDVINVLAGAYEETERSYLSAGVDIIGADSATTSILWDYAEGSEYWGSIRLDSPEGTNGDQTISGLTLDGNNTAECPIFVRGRSNLKFHDLHIKDFVYWGIYLTGRGDYNDEPPTSTWATGNEIYDCTITNCAGEFSAGADQRGSIMAGGQDGLKIYNCNLLNETRAGIGYRFTANGYNKNVEIYNDTIISIPGLQFYFAIVPWHEEGLHIHDNYITGAIDPNYLEKGDSEYGAYIHHNVIGQDTAASTINDAGIYIEFSCSDVIITRNVIRNFNKGISFSMRSGNIISDILIAYNKFETIGSSYDQSGKIINWSGVTDYEVHNYSFHNNTAYAYESAAPYWGVYFGNCDTITNVDIRNNIIRGFDAGGINFSNADIVDTLFITNNNLYNNGGSNAPVFSSGTPSHYTTANNLTSDPLLTDTIDFTLQVGSPAINAGIDLGYTTDILDSAIVGLPDIGAYELQDTATAFDDGILVDGNFSSAANWTVNAEATITTGSPGYVEFAGGAASGSCTQAGAVVEGTHLAANATYDYSFELTLGTATTANIDFRTSDGDNILTAADYTSSGTYTGTTATLPGWIGTDVGFVIYGSGSASNGTWQITNVSLTPQ